MPDLKGKVYLFILSNEKGTRRKANSWLRLPSILSSYILRSNREKKKNAGEKKKMFACSCSKTLRFCLLRCLLLTCGRSYCFMYRKVSPLSLSVPDFSVIRDLSFGIQNMYGAPSTER